MPTNVDFFRSFAEDTTTSKSSVYYFGHSDQYQHPSNLFDGETQGVEDLDNSQIKLFHFTRPNGIIPLVNESGGTDGVRYRGILFALIKSDLDEPIDVEIGEDDLGEVKKALGKYEKRVKALIEDGGIASDIGHFNVCTTGYELEFTNMTEVYNKFDYNMDGVMMEYEMTIRV